MLSNDCLAPGFPPLNYLCTTLIGSSLERPPDLKSADPVEVEVAHLTLSFLTSSLSPLYNQELLYLHSLPCRAKSVVLYLESTLSLQSDSPHVRRRTPSLGPAGRGGECVIKQV